MSSPGARRASTRTPLARRRILAAAVELADAQGVEALSMRKLAAHLGFEAMSLYNHVANKDDLLDGMLELVAEDFDAPPAGLPWRPALRHVALSAHRALLRHPWAPAQWPHRWPGPARWRYSEHLLGLIADGGFTGELADIGFHAVTLHVVGFTQQQIGYRMEQTTAEAMLRRFEREVSPDDYPLMVAHAQYHVERDRAAGADPDHRDEFDRVLDVILDGLESARDA